MILDKTPSIDDANSESVDIERANSECTKSESSIEVKIVAKEIPITYVPNQYNCENEWNLVQLTSRVVIFIYSIISTAVVFALTPSDFYSYAIGYIIMHSMANCKAFKYKCSKLNPHIVDYIGYNIGSLTYVISALNIMISNQTFTLGLMLLTIIIYTLCITANNKKLLFVLSNIIAFGVPIAYAIALGYVYVIILQIIWIVGIFLGLLASQFDENILYIVMTIVGTIEYGILLSIYHTANMHT